MTYDELQRIACKHTNKTKETQNAFDIAMSLNIRLKNSVEAKRDFKSTENPLEYSNGCLTVCNGEYTIYYNEKTPYCNFTIAHEIAHYLLHHYSDGAIQHRDANLLASMLIAPKKSVLKNKIKNEIELSEKYKIPIEVAQIYWDFLQIKPRKRYIKLCAVIITVVFLSYCGVLLYNNFNLPIPNTGITPTNTPITDMVFVTTSGSKYHKLNCYYIEGKYDLTELSEEQAKKLGYKECKICY